MNRRANYTVLAGLAELMMPKSAFPGVWPGILKFAKFPTLKNDPRNSVWKRSVTRNTLAPLKWQSCDFRRRPTCRVKKWKKSGPASSNDRWVEPAMIVASGTRLTWRSGCVRGSSRPTRAGGRERPASGSTGRELSSPRGGFHRGDHRRSALGTPGCCGGRDVLPEGFALIWVLHHANDQRGQALLCNFGTTSWRRTIEPLNGP